MKRSAQICVFMFFIITYANCETYKKYSGIYMTRKIDINSPPKSAGYVYAGHDKVQGTMTKMSESEVNNMFDSMPTGSESIINSVPPKYQRMYTRISPEGDHSHVVPVHEHQIDDIPSEDSDYTHENHSPTDIDTNDSFFYYDIKPDHENELTMHYGDSLSFNGLGNEYNDYYNDKGFQDYLKHHHNDKGFQDYLKHHHNDLHHEDIHKGDYYKHGNDHADSAYNNYDNYDKYDKEYYGNENNKGYYDNLADHRKHYLDLKDLYKKYMNTMQGEHGSSYAVQEKQNKANKVRGFHKVYHMDEYKKDHEFYDENTKNSEINRYGSGNKKFLNNEGGLRRTVHEESGNEAGKHGNKGTYQNGAHHNHQKGHHGLHRGLNHEKHRYGDGHGNNYYRRH